MHRPFGEEDRPFIRRLARFDEECRQRGIRVCLFYPAVPRKSYELHREKIEGLDALLRSSPPTAILNRPAEVAYPDDCFYDSASHQSGKGVILHTDHLIERLKLFLKKHRLF